MAVRMKGGQLSGLVTIPALSNPRDRGEAIEAEAVSDEYASVSSQTVMTQEEEAVCHQLVQALDLRWKWLFRPAALPELDQARASLLVDLPVAPICITCTFLRATI